MNGDKKLGIAAVVFLIVLTIGVVISFFGQWEQKKRYEELSARNEKMEIALILLSQGQAEQVLAMPVEELRGILAEAKKNVAPSPQPQPQPQPMTEPPQANAPTTTQN